MYKSPIEIICGDIKKQIDNDIYRVTQKYDIKVDKNELIQALQYDRDQYEKGYADGKRDAMDELVRCEQCRYYNDTEKRCDHPCLDFEVECYDHWLDMESGDFCSYGERREGE